MKRIGIWCIIGLLIVAGVHAQDEKHIFTDTQGRSIEAKIVACEFSKNKVTLERVEDKRRVTVPIKMFSDPDQAFIKEWYTAHELISDSSLMISCKEKTVDKRKEKKTVDVNDWSTGTTIGTRTKVKKIEKIGYEITLQNKGALPLQNMRLEYKIYYEQSETGSDPKMKQKVFKDLIKIESLKKRKKSTVETSPVEIYTEEQSESGNIVESDIKTGGKGEVHGMRARLYITLASGKEVYREFCEPSSLSNDRFPWEKSKE